MKHPPPIILTLSCAYGAGLATGLARFDDPGFVVAILGVAAFGLRRRVWGLGCLVCGVGVLAGMRARTVADGSCAARLVADPARFIVRVIDPGEGQGRVRVLDRQCTGAVIARWPMAMALVPAGSVVAADAHWVSTPRPLGMPDGVLDIESARAISFDPTLGERLRTAIVRNAHARFGPLAPLAIATVTGWRGELDRATRDAFAGAGLMHLLTVSGLHVAWMAGWMLLLLRLAGVGRHPAEAGATTTALAYAGLLGWPAAATRAAALLLLVAGCRWRQRQVRADALLAASALMVMVTTPWAIVGVGFWMSVVGVAGVAIATRWSDRAIGTEWWVRAPAASAGAIIGTAPLAAAIFGVVAPIGVAANMIAIPLMAGLLPAVLAAIALHAYLPWVAAGFATSGIALLHGLSWLASGAAALPHADGGGAGALGALPWIGLAGAGAWIIHGRATAGEAGRRMTWVLAGIACITVVLPVGPAAADPRSLTFFFADVGQGDGALIRTPLGHWIEVDAGPDEMGADAGRRVMAPLLERNGGRRIDLFVLSHAHRDHVGGATGVLAAVPVDLALEPGEIFADESYERWLAQVSARHVRWRSAHRGASWSIDGVGFQVMHPPMPWPREGEDLNEDSIVLLVTFGSFRALLMGDAGFVAESAMADDLGSVNFLKVGHHGSRTATSAAFLGRIRPQAALISVGRHNRYGHPAAETLGRLAAAGAAMWRTDLDGTVVVTTDGARFTVKGARGAATFGTLH